MKVYNPLPENIIRLTIIRQGEKTEYINLHQTTQLEVIAMIQAVIVRAQLPPFVTGKRTRVDIRDCIGGKNGKSKSLSFFGLSPEETKKLILKFLN